ncbi:MAG: non-homologous end-joining DNA ligase, partial [Candidatus Krumholzibacteriota bacterium]|nr:non-homologous end-joining DNA ligase [Candidatus Krumholzibacteriota bacterium]
MARSSQHVQVGKRRIELSNLEKVLWPHDGIIKAELVQYYLAMAPTILSHIKGRPLSLVRFPDGTEGERFFQKNLPHWTPKWIERAAIGDDEKTIHYMVATEDASLVWLANLACIELHQTHYRKPRYDNPDYFVFDLDPPNGYPFTEVVAIALELREHLEGFGYHPFVKTTGRKGLHVVVPIEPAYTFEQIFTAVRAMAGPFVSARSDRTTLHIKKESRKGRVLIDIYRNRQFQTIVSPYSVRGLAGAPVSTPLEWNYLASLQDHRELNIHTVPDRVIREGDPWQAIGAYAVTLHTERKNRPRKKTPDLSMRPGVCRSTSCWHQPPP